MLSAAHQLDHHLVDIVLATGVAVAAFADHELIERLGCGSVINVLAIYDDEVIGSANLLHEEHHYSEADIEDALPFVQLLVPALRTLSVAR